MSHSYIHATPPASTVQYPRVLGTYSAHTHRLPVPTPHRRTVAAARPQHTRAVPLHAIGGGAPVVSASAAHSSGVDQPAPTAWVLKNAALVLS